MDKRMTQTAAAEGLDFNLEGTLTGNTFDAHQLVHLAHAHGLQDAVVERLFRAYFTEQRSVFDPKELAELAVDAGLDRDEAAATLCDNRYAEAVQADIDLARDIGATGVPLFVFDNRYGTSGAQAPEAFWSSTRFTSPSARNPSGTVPTTCVPVLNPLMMGSTMRAAPSTMSSGGWKPLLGGLARGNLGRILVGDPAGVDAVHVDAAPLVVGRRRARHHVERRLRHVRVRMPGRLEIPVELPFHRRDVDDVLVALRRAEHERLQTCVEDERGDRVDEMHFEQFHRRDLVQQQTPGVAAAQIDLLQVLIELTAREEIHLAGRVLRQQRHL